METEMNGKKTLKVFPKGQVVIPAALRKKYNIDIGDYIDIVLSEHGILLKPSVKHIKKETKTDRLFGKFKTYATGKNGLRGNAIEKATEAGFIEGWTP